MLVSQALRRGDGDYALKDSRRKERLFADGRTKLLKAGESLSNLGSDYDPTKDSCLQAFVRMLAEAATEAVSSA